MASRAVTTEEPGSGIERRMLAVAVAWVGFSFDVPAVAKALWFPRVDLAVTRHWEGLGLEATRFSWKPDGEQGEASTTCPAATISVSGKKRHRTGGSGALPERDEERGQIASIPGFSHRAEVSWFRHSRVPSQYVFSRSQNLLMYIAGVMAVCHAVCITATAVRTPGVHKDRSSVSQVFISVVVPADKT
ncbi:uncharacterized protein [Lolium perenne]|uniref:uncharacterized protein isoform X5 n=1 Tax=Lolium perenne TaxID=4522 RepID=UPI003A99FFF9